MGDLGGGAKPLFPSLFPSRALPLTLVHPQHREACSKCQLGTRP